MQEIINDHFLNDRGIIPQNGPELIDSNGLARMLSVSKKFIEKHRNRIVGAIKIGGVWRFRIADIRMRIATGKDIFIK